MYSKSGSRSCASVAPHDPNRVASIMLSWHSLDLVSCTNLQTLWAGYGQIHYARDAIWVMGSHFKWRQVNLMTAATRWHIASIIGFWTAVIKLTCLHLK
jgi:hypothetical protein